jgi:hypothetical protein
MQFIKKLLQLLVLIDDLPEFLPIPLRKIYDSEKKYSTITFIIYLNQLYKFKK